MFLRSLAASFVAPSRLAFALSARPARFEPVFRRILRYDIATGASLGSFAVEATSSIPSAWRTATAISTC
jgi:hypothetical protein